MNVYENSCNTRRDGFQTRLYKNKYRIESTRLQGWNYADDGYYFITICTKNRECYFGNIEQENIILNEYGNIVQQCWNDLPNHYDNIKLDEFVIMPNHIHGIMIVDNEKNNIIGGNDVETGFKPVSTTNTTTIKKYHGIFEFVRALKTFSARRINKLRKSFGIPVWQSRFHDRIIRDENEVNRIREYITNNPQNWTEDENYISEASK